MKSPLRFSVFLLIAVFLQRSVAQTGYRCLFDLSLYPCRTYAFYRASYPDFLSLPSISDMFNVSPLMISRPSNLSSPSIPLISDQNLLIPITCSCTANNSYANVTYQIKSGDTFYIVSTSIYQNLTTYQAVELVNPSLVPTNLTVGVDVIFPIFCQCPNRSQLQNNVSYIITYVPSSSDTLSSITRKFGSNQNLTRALNGGGNGTITPFSTLLVPVSQIPQFSQPESSSSSPSPPPSPSPLSPPAPSSSRGERRAVVVGLSIGLGFLGFLLLLAFGVLWYLWAVMLKKYKGRGRGQMEARSIEQENLMADVSECLDKYKIFGIEELREATKAFDKSCLIEGSVYKGLLRGEMYAIKSLKWNAYEELKILQKVNHQNLVRLEGFCVEPEEGNCYLVYEYITNGSLHSWLHRGCGSKQLDWQTRVLIAVDVASGLQYIHEHTRPSVVHKDIKSSNILLDANLRAKIANFGLAKTGKNAVTMHIVGTQGYLAPEYLLDGYVTPKMDVFAFGVVLLELVSRREAVSEQGQLLWVEADRLFAAAQESHPEKLRAWMDSALAEQPNVLDGVVNVMTIAKACLQRDPAKRPSMVDIVYMLCKADQINVDVSQDGLLPGGIKAR